MFISLDSSELYYILGFPISDEKLYKVRRKMNEYLKAFQKINQSSTQLLTNDSKSLEIKQAATELNKSLQPFYKELQESATRLKSYLQKSFEELDYADAVWDSKPRIAAAPKAEIWEHIGELSGRHFRIQKLSRQCKEEALKEAKRYWEDKVETLKKKWFIDKNSQMKEKIGWGDKDGFIKDIRPEVHYAHFPLPELSTITANSLIPIHQEINLIRLELILECLKLLDWKLQTSLSKKLELIVSEIEAKLGNSENNTNKIIPGFKDSVRSHLVNWEKWGDIPWNELVGFKKKVWSTIENDISLYFDEQVKLATHAIDEAIAFYSDFLAKQERYQQETPEQKETEKVWIKQQREELQRVKQGLEEILNPFSN
ncbi:hypothetical protein IQ264_15975 [Phormidium sp. LEGE 05292]|uniref:hypothetical protein n=1 Tax=[Phormidium] sp. LEGE 05292 TaxID=767427 RepID=UPI001880ACCB|nr:hypothetical protein [Phormidium sp. LEGE 05292]MBE9226926.1 hypothetical protein [Phormidium sp. LEGE 05292]